MDPVFNDTSTYERSGYSHEPLQVQNGWSTGPKDGQEGMGLSRDSGSLQQSGNPMMNGMRVSAADIYSSNPAGTQHGGHVNPNLARPDPTQSHAPPVVPVSQGFATASEIDNASNPVQPARVDDVKEDAGPNAAGVNFQTLLDNLSHPPSDAATTGAAPSLVEGSSLHQAPTDESLQVLPTRSLQDPSIHPHYASNDDLAYHQLHPAPNTATSPAYATQASNHAQQSFPPSMPPEGAPGTGSGVGSLPPPPVASFQHTSASGADTQASQEALAQAAKKGRVEKQSVRTSKGADDDSPWGPEVQKKYDDFLHDERTYVTEGLWDRFPIGSRLFVGQFAHISRSSHPGN